MLFKNCTGHTKTLSWRHACVLTTRLKTVKTVNVTVACVDVIRGLTADPFGMLIESVTYCCNKQKGVQDFG